MVHSVWYTVIREGLTDDTETEEGKGKIIAQQLDCKMCVFVFFSI